MFKISTGRVHNGEKVRDGHDEGTLAGRDRLRLEPPLAPNRAGLRFKPPAFFCVALVLLLGSTLAACCIESVFVRSACDDSNFDKIRPGCLVAL